MKINGSELTTKDMFYIRMLNEHNSNPKLLDFIWVNKYRKILKTRLEKLQKDFGNDKVSTKAYVIWKKMLNEAIKEKEL